MKEVKEQPARQRWQGGANFFLLCLVAAILVPAASARGQDPDGAPRAPREATPPDYMVSPEDVLDVYVFDVPEISRTYRVSPTGFISLPLIPEPVAVAGLAPSEIARVIETKFRDSGLLKSPQIVVSVKETRLHSVVISGAVKNPQVYPLFGPTRLLNAISQAGGLADDAGNVCIIHRGPIARRVTRLGDAAEGGVSGQDSASTVRLDARKLVETGDESLNVLLYPGDRVTVQRAPIVYVIGAVARPGGYPLKDPQEEITVLKALALAGDVTGSAKRSKLVILRRNSQDPGHRQEVPLDLKKIIAGQAPDPQLVSDDILFVPENSKGRAVRSAVGTGIGLGTAITTGLIIYRR